MKTLIKVLQLSAEKNGADKPLTIGHLLNICLLVDKLETEQEIERFEQDQQAYNEAMLSTLDF